MEMSISRSGFCRTDGFELLLLDRAEAGRAGGVRDGIELCAQELKAVGDAGELGDRSEQRARMGDVKRIGQLRAWSLP